MFVEDFKRSFMSLADKTLSHKKIMPKILHGYEDELMRLSNKRTISFNIANTGTI